MYRRMILVFREYWFLSRKMREARAIAEPDIPAWARQAADEWNAFH
jgi:hypothetical protein